MDQSIVEYLGTKGILSEFVKTWGVDESFQWMFSYETLCEKLKSDMLVRGIIALDQIPFIRPEYMHLSAVLPRVDASYHLDSDVEKGNMAFWSSADQLAYSCSNVPYFLKSINTEIKLAHIGEDAFSKYETGIQASAYLTTKQYQIPLSTAEFVPKPSAGIFVLVCHKDDLVGRMLAAKYHDASTFAISNIQRQVQRDWSSHQQSQLLGVYVHMDNNQNYLGTVVSRMGDSLSYFNHSQSSHLGFATALIKA